MLEARKSRISDFLQILNKADTHYRIDIQRFKWPNTINLKIHDGAGQKSTAFDYYLIIEI